MMNACQIDKQKNLKKHSWNGFQWGLSKDLILASSSCTTAVGACSDLPSRAVSVGLVLLYLWPYVQHQGRARWWEVGLVGAYLSSLYPPVMRAQPRNDLTPLTWRQVICGYWQTYLQFLWKGKRPKIASTTLRKKKKNLKTDIIWLKTYYKATTINTGLVKNRSVNTTESSQIDTQI